MFLCSLSIEKAIADSKISIKAEGGGKLSGSLSLESGCNFPFIATLRPGAELRASILKAFQI